MLLTGNVLCCYHGMYYVVTKECIMLLPGNVLCCYQGMYYVVTRINSQNKNAPI